jgi:uncharacterized membrane protein
MTLRLGSTRSTPGRLNPLLRRENLAPGAVYLLILLYAAFFTWLSVVRHEMLGTNAMDLGYTDQVVWNTLHGRFYRFSTFQNVPVDLPLDQFRRTDTLLAYHVELLLAPLSLTYLIYDSPVTLLVLQSVILGLGALPAFWLARDHLGSPFAGVAFAAAYLLAPAVEGANLSDFHAVSLTASLLLFALYFLHVRRYGPFLICAVLAMSTKEDVPLLILMIGLYAAAFLRERVVGAITSLLGLGWFLACIDLILPYYNGLPTSPFFHRVTIFGPTIKDSILNLLHDPLPLWHWVRRPEILTYLGGLLSSAGFASLFSPIVLALSAPVVAMNVFSTWSWTYSEGAHYSASIIPFVIVSGIYGLGVLSRWLSRWTKLPRQGIANGLAGLVLLASAIHHYQIGISPLSQSYHQPEITPHQRLAKELMALIPPDAPLSAGSGLYPHLAHREKAYFFPAVNDAEYVILDVTGSPYPIRPEEVHETVQRLLSSGEFGVLAARDGYLVLERGLPWPAGASLPDAFYTFARVDEGDIRHPLHARFGDALELLGYDYTIHNVVHAEELPATVTTYWRPKQPLPAGQTLALFFTRDDGAIVYAYDGATPATLWYPVERWAKGEVIRVETPVLGVGRLRDTMIAVVQPGADPWSADGRLPPLLPAGDPELEVFDQGTLLRLFRFP